MKVSFCLLLFLGFSISGKGQQFEFGPELGTNILSVDKDTLGNKFVPNYHIGCNAIYHINDYWSVKSGVFLTQKTHYYSESDTSQLNLFGFEDQIDQVENLDLSIFSYMNSKTSQFFIEMPIVGTFHYKQFSVSLGGYGNYMLFSKTKREEITEVPVLQVIDIKAFDPSGTFSNFLPDPYQYEFNDDANVSSLANWDFGLRGGLGMEIGRIGINAYYNLGLTKFRSEINSKYNYVQFTLNYKFSFTHPDS